MVAASAVRLAGIDPAGGATKLGEGLEPTSGPAPTELPADEAVVTLFQAVADRRVAEFPYRGEPRTVHPLRLRFTKGRWYLNAWDAARDAERQFRLDRIDGPVTTGDPGGFVPRAVTSVDALDEPWAMGEGPTRPVRVRIDAVRAEAARRAAPGVPAEVDDDGSVVLTLAVRNVDALGSFVLGFLEQAEVLGPDDVRDQVLDRVRARAAMAPTP